MSLDNEDKEALIKYRLSRADETMVEAKTLADINHWNTAANRLYYACFYAILACFVDKKLNVATHGGVKTLFNLHLVKTGLVDKKWTKHYSDLFNKRQESDYKDFQVFVQEDIEHLIPETEEFIKIIKQIIDNQ
jgi:uncharacterized protein (UPF0332 family)